MLRGEGENVEKAALERASRSSGEDAEKNAERLRARVRVAEAGRQRGPSSRWRWVTEGFITLDEQIDALHSLVAIDPDWDAIR